MIGKTSDWIFRLNLFNFWKHFRVNLGLQLRYPNLLTIHDLASWIDTTRTHKVQVVGVWYFKKIQCDYIAFIFQIFSVSKEAASCPFGFLNSIFNWHERRKVSLQLCNVQIASSFSSNNATKTSHCIYNLKTLTALPLLLLFCQLLSFLGYLSMMQNFLILQYLNYTNFQKTLLVQHKLKKMKDYYTAKR